MLVARDIPLPWWQKYTLTIEEAAQYFGIGEKTLRRFVKEHEDKEFLLHNGAKVHIKRKAFEEYLDENFTVI